MAMKLPGNPMKMPTLDMVLPLTNDEDAYMDNDDHEEDRLDEKHLMSMLQKLQTAKRTIDSTHQKKKMKEILSQSAKTFESESSDMINKHNKRWSTKIGNIQQKFKKMRSSMEITLQDIKTKNEDTISKYNVHKIQIENVMNSMKDLERQVMSSKASKGKEMANEIATIRKQIHEKLKVVQATLIKTHERSNSDDKFTKIIRTFLASF